MIKKQEQIFFFFKQWVALEKGRPLREGVNKPSWLTSPSSEEGTNKRTLHHLGQLHHSMEIEGGSMFLSWWWWPPRTWDSHTKTLSKVGHCLKGWWVGGFASLNPNSLLWTTICQPDLHKTNITPGVNIKTNKMWCDIFNSLKTIMFPLQRSPRKYTIRMTKTNNSDLHFRIEAH